MFLDGVLGAGLLTGFWVLGFQLGFDGFFSLVGFRV